MKLIVQTIAILAASWIAMLFLPWYSIAFISFAFGYIFKSNANFLAGFLGVALLWILAFAMHANDSALPKMVAEIFQVKNEIWLVIAAAILAGISAGFACISGSLLKTEKKRKYY